MIFKTDRIYCDQSMEYLRRIIVYHTAVMKNVLHIFTVKKAGQENASGRAR